MFEVRTYFPMTDEWQTDDARARGAAGVKSSFSGCSNPGAEFGACRDIGWEVPTFDQAQEVRRRLVSAGFDQTTVREA